MIIILNMSHLYDKKNNDDVNDNGIFEYTILIFFMILFLCFSIFCMWFIFNHFKNRKTKVSNLKILYNDEDENNDNTITNVIIELPEQNLQINRGMLWMISFTNNTQGKSFHEIVV